MLGFTQWLIISILKWQIVKLSVFLNNYLLIIGPSYLKPSLNIIEGKKEYKIEVIIEYSLKNA